MRGISPLPQAKARLLRAVHVRTVDDVRVVELICVAQRLLEQMADDGAWKRQAELDH